MIRKEMKNFGYCLRHFFLNLAFLLSHLKHIPRARRNLEMIANSIRHLDDLDDFIKKIFKYKKDIKDMRPWVINFAIKEYRDDCDGIAAFSKWISRKRHWKAEYWSLFGKNWGHALCLITWMDSVYIADTKGVRPFISWVKNFPRATRKIKRWY